MRKNRYKEIGLLLQAWGCPVLTGWKALLRCAVIAAQHEEWGKAWTPMGVCQEAAALMHKTQWAVWKSMEYTLRKSRSAPRSVSVAIALLVEGVTK